MHGNIKVDPRKLQCTANQFQASGNQIKATTTRMTSIVNSLSGAAWEGHASMSYKKKFGELQDDINRIIKMVNEHVADLNQMARTYEMAENRNSQSACALSGNVVA